MAVLLLLVNPIFVFGGLAVLAVMWISLKYPYAGLVLYLATEYIRPGEIVPALGALHLARIIIFFTAIGWIVSIAKGKERNIAWTGQTWAIVGFAAVMVISVFTAVWSGKAVESAVDGVKIAMVFILMINLITTERRLQLVVWLLVILALWISGDSMLRYLSTGKPVRGITSGFLGDENDLALALLVILPLAAVLYQVSLKSLQRAVAGVAFVGILWSVIFTFSRGGFLGLLFVLLMLGVFSRKRLISVGLSLIVITVMWLAAPTTYHNRVSTIAQYKKDESAKGRILAWQASRAMFHDRPFFGVGPGNFETAYGLFYKPPGAEAVWRAAHSIYFQCLGELGAFGCLLFGMMVFFTFLDLYKIGAGRTKWPVCFWQRKLAVGLAIGMGVYLVSGTFLSAIYYPHPYIVAAMTVSLHNIGKNISRQETEEVAHSAMHRI
jgi:probable O-glycosylation ligase (exosortase A-associated)